MEKLKLNQSGGLMLYCFSFKPRSVFDTSLGFPEGNFFLGYGVEDLDKNMNQKYPNVMGEIIVHGVMEFKHLLDMVEIPGPDNFEEKPVATKEYNQIQFVNGLRLVADRYVAPEDKKTILDILDRVNFERSENIS